jgi:beta-N-acetylglucosaminidase
VGVYDSRGIEIAYANSEHWSKVLKEKQAALEQAKKDGDTEKVKEIEAWFPARQTEAHLKAFGTAPVHECFEPVKDKIAAVAKQAGVDVIVSKWVLDYLAADAETVDVTMELAKLFNPKEKAYQWIEDNDRKPISHEELRRLEKEHSH